MNKDTAVLGVVDETVYGPRPFPWIKLYITIVVVALIAGIGLLVYSYNSTLGLEDTNRNRQSNLEKVWEAQPPIGEALGAAVGNPTIPPDRRIPPLGTSLARIWAPSLGERWIIVEGIDESDISSAPGHYPGTAMPGQRGNFSVAGHRSPGLFWNLDRLHGGDKLVVETKTGFHIYRVVHTFITSPAAKPEVSAVPPGYAAGSKLLTLTTCNPKTDNYQRLIVRAVYEKTVKTWVP